MRKIISLIVFLFINVTSQSIPALPNDSYITYSFYNGINDSWYEATVGYTNYKTGTVATYTLNVKVEYETVEVIDFGNGGSVHSGYNHEGYIYSGGELDYETDYSGNIIAATTTVRVSDHNGMKTFEISIE